MGAAARTAKPQGYYSSGIRAGERAEREQRAEDGVTSEPRDRAAGRSKAAFWSICGSDVLQKGVLREARQHQGPQRDPEPQVAQVMTGQDPGSSPLPELHKAPFPFHS